MIVDEITLTVSAGKGGDGCVSYRREKGIDKGGPDGGNGGRGGDVYFIGVSNLTALNKFRSDRKIAAQDGGNGKSKKRHGASGSDLLLRIPIGTIITDINSEWKKEITFTGQKILVARGGEGGRGNWELRSSFNKTPRLAESGVSGQTKHLNFNLQYIAEIGIIGLPNAGKSTLLNCLTNAQAKIADYPFTTLEPNLGAMDTHVIADIPGLITGASKGRGLGIKFLKHIKKTRILIHCIDSTTKKIVSDYQTIRKELKNYDPDLLRKKEIIVLTKIDLLDENHKLKLLSLIKGYSTNIMAISVLIEKDITALKRLLLQILR